MRREQTAASDIGGDLRSGLFQRNPPEADIHSPPEIRLSRRALAKVCPILPGGQANLQDATSARRPRHMTPQENTDAEIIAAEIKVVVPPSEDLPLDSDGFSRLLRTAGVVTGGIDLAKGAVVGLTARGVQASEALARSLRDRHGRLGQRAANATVANLIRSYALGAWTAHGGQLTAADCTALEQAVLAWLSAQAQTRRHYVPCTLFAYRLGSFAVGPVQFHHLHDLPTASMNATREEFWPARSKPAWRRRLRDAVAILRGKDVATPQADTFGQTPGGFYYQDLVRLCQERHAWWIAEVEVPGREEGQSIVTADFAVNIALAALTLALPGDELRTIARASERARPVWRVDVWTGTQTHGSRNSNREPGRTLSPEVIACGLKGQAGLLESMGRRLESYVAGRGALPNLNESWCNAAYWFHEALLENVEGVAVAQFETAMEVLFSTASTKISTGRLMGAMAGLLGKAEGDPIVPNSPVTVRTFVSSLVTARSRVLHGTWPTLSGELPLSVRITNVEALARTLLTAMSVTLDAYEAAGRTEDDIKEFLDWATAQRTSGSGSVGGSAP